MNADRIARFRELTNMEVWNDIRAEAAEIVNPCREYIDRALIEHPEKLTTKTAIAKGNMARGVTELIEVIASAAKQ